MSAEPCAALLRHGTQEEPPEYCDEDALEGSEFCEDHQEPDDEYEPERFEPSWADEHSHTL